MASPVLRGPRLGDALPVTLLLLLLRPLRLFRSLRPVLLLVLIALIPGRAGAQIVNIESILVGEPKDGFGGAVQIGFRYLKGNSEYRQLEGNGLVRWKGEGHIFQLVLGGMYKTAGEKKVADNSLGHLRYGHEISDRIRLEALLQIQQNEFVRLKRRLLTGAGFRANILESDTARIDLGLILMHENELLRNAVSEPGWRASTLVSAGWELTSSVQLSGQVYVQPLLGDPGDYRILSDTGLTVRVLGPLSLQMSARVVYDSRPPAGVETTDISLRNTLAITF